MYLNLKSDALKSSSGADYLLQGMKERFDGSQGHGPGHFIFHFEACARCECGAISDLECDLADVSFPAILGNFTPEISPPSVKELYVGICGHPFFGALPAVFSIAS